MMIRRRARRGWKAVVLALALALLVGAALLAAQALEAAATARGEAADLARGE
jgi:peptidoglycan/LPS O-acetylase OafA/YrhL